MAAPRGNQNAAKGKRWMAAIERALVRRTRGEAAPEKGVSDLIRGLDAAADEFVANLFSAKDLGYFKELADRLDGKPHQTIVAEVDTNVTVEVVRFGAGKTAK